jgi:alpha-L-fucosidase
VVEQLKSFISSIQDNHPQSISFSDWVEVLASLHYLKQQTFEGKKLKTFNALYELLRKKKPWVDRAIAYVACRWLSNSNLIPRIEMDVL